MHASCGFVDYVKQKGPRSCVGMFRMLVNLVNLRQQRAWIMAVSRNNKSLMGTRMWQTFRFWVAIRRS